jgi:hypothetical protein
MKQLLLLLAILLSLPTSALAIEYQTLKWPDLLPTSGHPSGSKRPETAVNHNGKAIQQEEGSVRADLDQRQVRVPGYVVPVDGNEETVSSFLLVPFFGACIHVPPPPSNQIIYVTLQEPVAVDELWEAVWVYGTLHTTRTSHELANSGYQMQGIRVESYE